MSMGNSKLALGLVLLVVFISSASAYQQRPEEVFQQCQQRCQSQSQYGGGQVGQYQCQLKCVKELQRQTGRGDYGDRDIDIDVNESRSDRGYQYDPEEYSECMDRCSDRKGWQQFDCIMRCTKQQGHQGQRGQQRWGQQQDNQEWYPEHGGQGSRGGRGYEGQCMQRCTRQPGQQQQQYCMSQCKQQQGSGYKRSQVGLRTKVDQSQCFDKCARQGLSVEDCFWRCAETLF